MDAIPDARLRGALAGAMDHACADHDANVQNDVHASTRRAALRASSHVITMWLHGGEAIRIPKALLDESGLRGEVEIRARRGSLVISAAAPARSGWDQAFRQMAGHGDDRLLDADAPSAEPFDAEGWEWK